MSNPEYITLTQAADELPARRKGRKTPVCTLYRWTTFGCRGVRLRYTQVGATRCTTRQWLNEFFNQLTGEKVEVTPNEITPMNGEEPKDPIPPMPEGCEISRQVIERLAVRTQDPKQVRAINLCLSSMGYNKLRNEAHMDYWVVLGQRNLDEGII